MKNRSVLEKSLIVDYLKEFEDYCLEKTEVKSYVDRNLRKVQKLRELSPEEPLYHLMKAAVLIRGGKMEEGEAILKKYERNPALQFRNVDFRAGFLYLAGKLTEDAVQRRNIVLQLQKLYQKNAAQPSLYWYLVQLDEGFEKNPQKKIAFLEKQWRLGCRQNLLYIEVIKTLKVCPEAVGSMDDFLMQCSIWALRRNCITKELGTQIAKSAMRLKNCDGKYEYVLKECYRIFSTKELLGALCSLYMRSGRTDQTAAYYYGRGVQYDLKLNNLHEYYMMATTGQQQQLLPEQVLLYFLYHDTLTDSQRVYLYKNIVCYGEQNPEIYERYIGKIEKYTVDSLLKRRISTEYAYLYKHVLHPEIFTKEMAEAMADLMFLRKLTCSDGRIREAEVSYSQLKRPKKAVFKKQQAYLPIYTPSAIVTLIDEEGNQYRNTVSYQMEKLLDEKDYIEICKKYVEHHEGLLLYLLGRNAEPVPLNQKTVQLYRQIPETAAFKEEYRRETAIRLMEFDAANDQLDQIPEEWFSMDGAVLNREQRGKILLFLIKKEKYEQAFEWAEHYGIFFVPAVLILKMLTALEDSKKAEEELYYRLCYSCFKSGQKNYTILKYLANSFLGTCQQMAEVWEHAKAYGVDTFGLEERILMQMMFTGTKIREHFEIYLSYNQKTPDLTIKKAYLTYLSREVFFGREEPDERFYFLLEEELISKQGYADICILTYLKYLSEKEEMSARQKSMASAYLKMFFSKKCYYEFMQNFGRMIPEALILEDKMFIEYAAPSSSKVVLHYIIEKEGKKAYRYTACRLYPSYGGLFSKAFSMLQGEKITYFITEKREDGKEITTPSVTKEKNGCSMGTDTKYKRFNRIRQLKEEKDGEAFLKEIEAYRYLEKASKELFSMK